VQSFFAADQFHECVFQIVFAGHRTQLIGGALRDDLATCLAVPPAPTFSGRLKAVIVPHAGYVYSGGTAGKAYALLAPLAGRIRRVVLLGPCHRVAVRGLAAPTVQAFATPLGNIPLDRAALDALADLPQVVASDAAHAQEHSLEVQLPFLQTVLGDFTLVPLAVGQTGAAEVARNCFNQRQTGMRLGISGAKLNRQLEFPLGIRIFGLIKKTQTGIGMVFGSIQLTDRYSWFWPAGNQQKNCGEKHTESEECLYSQLTHHVCLL